jgi:hypothetical protein
LRCPQLVLQLTDPAFQGHLLGHVEHSADRDQRQPLGVIRRAAKHPQVAIVTLPVLHPQNAIVGHALRDAALDFGGRLIAIVGVHLPEEQLRRELHVRRQVVQGAGMRGPVELVRDAIVHP